MEPKSLKRKSVVKVCACERERGYFSFTGQKSKKTLSESESIINLPLRKTFVGIEERLTEKRASSGDSAYEACMQNPKWKKECTCEPSAIEQFIVGL